MTNPEHISQFVDSVHTGVVTNMTDEYDPRSYTFSIPTVSFSLRCMSKFCFIYFLDIDILMGSISLVFYL